jgi:hypothetical protein
VVFVANEDEGVEKKVVNSPVEAQDEIDEPDENVKLGVGLSTKSVSGGHVKDSPTETFNYCLRRSTSANGSDSG